MQLQKNTSNNLKLLHLNNQKKTHESIFEQISFKNKFPML